MKVAAKAAHSLWTAPDESWKPWQQAHTQESAKNAGSIEMELCEEALQYGALQRRDADSLRVMLV